MIRLIGVKQILKGKRYIIMKKRIFAAFAAMAVLSAATVTSFAEYDPNKIVNDNEMSTRMITVDYNLNLNGNNFDSPEPYYNEDGVLMLPLRAMTEKMGFTVEWQGETGTIVLTNGPVYITMSAFEDGYTFSRTAPMMLGSAPVLTDGVTYVPANFVTDILGGAYRTEEDGTIRLFDSESKNVALIESVNAEEKQILVNDIVMGNVLLNISDETYITDEEGNTVAFDELVEGLTLKVGYSEIMTRSLPPMNTPDTIVVKAGSPAMPLPSDEEVASADTAIVEIVNGEENTVSVNDLVRGEVLLTIADETVITGIDGEEITLADIKEGMTIEIVYGEAMTMSLPPQNTPVSIKVISEEPIVQIEPAEELEAYPGPDAEITPVEPEAPVEK